jgi:dihydroorotase
VASGSAAAALGGYTAVFAMPNTEPTADTAGVVEQVWRLGREAGRVDVQPIGAVTVGRQGVQLAELGAMADSAAQVRVFSDDGSCVSDPLLMRRALEYVKAFDGVVAQHAEDPRLTVDAQMNEGEVSGRIGLAGWPGVAEEAIIARDVLLAAHVGLAVARLPRLHRGLGRDHPAGQGAGHAGQRGGDPAPPAAHRRPGRDLRPRLQGQPAVAHQADVEALRAGLADGTIDCVATDHAPHATEDKETEWGAARPGMLGLQTALSVVMESCSTRWGGVASPIG